MCGIAGVIHFDGKPVDPGLIGRMTQLIAHRGPDGEGKFLSGPVGLGHRRLAIIDLSEAAHQPMLNDDESLALVYNGECYNHKELRRELAQRGYKFKSTSDTEVVLRGYEAYGKSFFSKMIGMFALAIWDKRRGELVLCRDRVGIKPFYYYRSSKGDRLAFASEIKPLLEAGAPVDLNLGSLGSYLSLRYVPGSATMFGSIEKLDPGTILTVDRSGNYQHEAYWDLTKFTELSPQTEKEAAEKFYELLERSVALCLESDVPVGSFLSGGIDSSAVSALMSQSRSDVETFTVKIGSSVDESVKAAAFSHELGLSNTQIAVSADDVEQYARAVFHLEEPIGDSIIMPTFLLAREAAKKVKVVQIGEGADEILAGYVHQFVMTKANPLRHLAAGMPLSGAASLARLLPHAFWKAVFPYPGDPGAQGLERLFRYLGALRHPPKAYLELTSLFSGADKARILNPAVLEQTEHEPLRTFERYWSSLKNKDFQNKLLELDLRYWNTDYTMLRIDKLTMASSLEARVPFLDHRLIELCLSLPANFKTRGLTRKRLLRLALKGKGLIPEKTRLAPKTPFHLPPEKTLGRRFEEFVSDVLSESAVLRRGIFNADEVARLVNKGSARELVESKQVMALAIFELWAGYFLDGRWRHL